MSATAKGLTVAVLSALVCASTAAHANSLDDALTGGAVNVDIRLRYETVDDSTNQNAKALTVRSRLGYTTGDFYGVELFGEFVDVRIVGGIDDYAPVTSGYATIADPEVVDVNQAVIGYKGLPDTTLKVGRQRLILDNARHIGNVGWRQNEQTFDAVSIVNASIPNTNLTYAFLDRVNGITASFDANVTGHLLNVAFSGIPVLKVTGYSYNLKDDDTTLKTNTHGLRLAGKTPLSERAAILYTAEVAIQSTDTADAIYAFLEGGGAIGPVTAKLGYELLGSDDGAYGFQTPLATKHAFNGWADKFLVTPAEGLRDAVLSLGATVVGVQLLGVYHDFSSDEGNIDYGSELDVVASKKLGRYVVGAKYAGYGADTFSADTTKMWLWVELNI